MNMRSYDSSWLALILENEGVPDPYRVAKVIMESPEMTTHEFAVVREFTKGILEGLG